MACGWAIGWAVGGGRANEGARSEIGRVGSLRFGMDQIVTFVLGGAAALLIGVLLVLLLRRGAKSAPTTVHTVTMAERVRAVGKLVGLEVHAKEIATSKQGWAWLPPIVLSQAKIAMIFHFEKQYAVDLARINDADIEKVDEDRYVLTLPEVEGTLRLTDLTPYDVQAGRVLGLLDIIQLTAERQKKLIDEAQQQAGELFERNDARYVNEAKRSIERHLRSLFGLVGAEVEVCWPPQTRTSAAEEMRVEMAELAGR